MTKIIHTVTETYLLVKSSGLRTSVWWYAQGRVSTSSPVIRWQFPHGFSSKLTALQKKTLFIWGLVLQTLHLFHDQWNRYIIFPCLSQALGNSISFFSTNLAPSNWIAIRIATKREQSDASAAPLGALNWVAMNDFAPPEFRDHFF